MPIEVELPDGSVAEFPDGIDPAAMKAAIAKRFPPSRRQQSKQEVREQGAKDYTGGLGSEFSQFSNLVMDPFGVRDEMIGAGQFVKELVTSGGDVGQASQAYSDAAERVRAEQEVAREDYGILPEIVGGFGTTGIAKGFQMAPTLAGRVKQSALTGGGFGAVTGAAQSEGGVPERLIGAAEGGLTGAALGPVVTEVGGPLIGGIVRGAKTSARGLSDATRYLRGRNQNVDARIARSLSQQKMTPRDALARLDEADQAAKFGRTQLDPEFTMADLGRSTRDLADAASLVSSEARGEAAKFLQGRSQGQYGRINDYLRRSLNVTRDNFAKTQAKLVNDQRQLSKAAYDQAYGTNAEFDVGNVLFNKQLEAFETTGPLSRALNRARSLFIDKSRTPGYQAVNNIQRFDIGKRALDDMIESASRAGRNNEARMLIDLKRDLVSVADQATTLPGTNKSLYQAARDVYSSRAELLEALDEGRKFMRGDAEMTAQQYKNLGTGEKRMFRIGMARQVRKDLGRKRIGTDMIGHFDKPNVREVLEEIMSPAKARQFYELIDLEQAMAATSQGVRGGSPTAERQQKIQDFSFGVRLGRAIKDQGLREALGNEIAEQITKFFSMREGDAVAVTRALLSTDRAAQRTTLNRIAQTYGNRSARAIVNRAERIARKTIANRRRSLAGVAGIVGGQPNQPAQQYNGQPAIPR